MNVFPPSTVFQPAQGPAAQPATAAARRDALIQAALSAAGRRGAAERPRPAEPAPPASPADWPPATARRGSLIDICV